MSDCWGRFREGERSEDLVSGSQFGPRLVCPAIVVLSLGDLHVLVEAQDLSGLQLGNGGSLTQLQNERRFSVSLSCSANTAGYPLRSLTFLVSRRLISRTSACLSAWFLAAKGICAVVILYCYIVTGCKCCFV